MTLNTGKSRRSFIKTRYNPIFFHKLTKTYASLNKHQKQLVINTLTISLRCKMNNYALNLELASTDISQL